MRHTRRTLPLVILAVLVLPSVTIPGHLRAQSASLPIALELVTADMFAPVDLADPNDGSGRLFVVEQPGTIMILQDGALVDAPFLDLSAEVSTDSEQGLLGMALHPDFAGNGRLFVNFTDADGATRIVEYRVDPGDPSRVDTASARTILTVPQPYPNHNGGGVVFGPDGMLYIGLGDGGSGGDPEGHGQNPDTLLGTILRIDIDDIPSGAAYGIPADNPFVAGGGAPEVWVYGMRNPWRFSFDRATGDLWIGDVGQAAWEEIDRLPAGEAAGANLGWAVLEGNACYEADTCATDGMVMPVHVYDHSDGACSITGGVVYRGAAIPALAGVYLFADFCTGIVEGLAPAGDGSWSLLEGIPAGEMVSAFAQDAAGEIYVLTYSGAIYRVVPA